MMTHTLKHESETVVDERLASIHATLVNRIINRARSEGNPLSELEIRQFESERMAKEEHRRFSKQFDQEVGWQEFLDRTSGLLSRAIVEDSEKDPDAAGRYDQMVHDLEQHGDSFTLWACCVPAIKGYKSQTTGIWHSVVAAIVILFIVLMVSMRMLRIL
jgi:hypothetical protein